jgi:hypothetical protein
MRLINNDNLQFLNFFNNQITQYSVYAIPGFGFLLVLCLLIQIITCIFLSVHYFFLLMHIYLTNLGLIVYIYILKKKIRIAPHHFIAW